jgi:hypothetical protein
MRDNRNRRSRRGIGCQGGCAGCGCVLTIGLILALLGAALGITISARIPGTHSNITIAGSIGKKTLTRTVLPAYARKTFGKDNNFINSSHSLVVGPAQGLQEIVLGKQPAAPVAGIAIHWKSK